MPAQPRGDQARFRAGTFTIAPVSTAVPEPTSIALLASGLVGALLRGRRSTR
jgi:hypothetical protein